LIVDTQEVLALYDREQRRDIEFPDMTREAVGGVVRYVRPAPGMNFVLYSELDEATADAAIEAQIAYFDARGQPFEWKAYAHDRPADLAQRLAARGFELEEPADAIMVLDVAAAPAALLAAPAADVRRLSDPAQLVDVISVLEPVWGREFTWVHERLGGHMAIPDYLSVYVAYVDDRPACAGWVYYSSPHFAGLWGGSTLEAYRGRGLYTAVLAARVQEAHRRGIRYLTIDAGEMSRPIVARHGFEVITYATACEWQGEGADRGRGLEAQRG
jgi:GNAT superfamily N-acetyltransferase